MSVSFCPACGAEYVAGVMECVDCLVELVPGAAQALGEESADDELAFELSDWEPELRAELGRALVGESIPFRWEDDDLIVREDDGDRVEAILDKVEYPDALEASDDDGGGDEVAQGAMSDLFVAADRLAKDPSDGRAAGDLVDAAERVHSLSAPFGFGPEAWAQVRELAAAVRDDLATDADDEVVEGDARTLREVLRRYV